MNKELVIMDGLNARVLCQFRKLYKDIAPVTSFDRRRIAKLEEWMLK